MNQFKLFYRKNLNTWTWMTNYAIFIIIPSCRILIQIDTISNWKFHIFARNVECVVIWNSMFQLVLIRSIHYQKNILCLHIYTGPWRGHLWRHWHSNLFRRRPNETKHWPNYRCSETKRQHYEWWNKRWKWYVPISEK